MSTERKMFQTFRHRGFQPADPGQELIEMFGHDPAPLNPDGTPMKKLWDNDHEQHTIVRKHVDAPLAPAPEPVSPGATVADPHDEPPAA